MESENKHTQVKAKKILTVIAFVLLIIIIIFLLLRSCENTPDKPFPDQTQGEWNIGDKRPDQTQESSIIPENITFLGSDRYTVSKNNKDIEMINPKINQVNFVFTVTDAKTGEVIAKTDKVAPGQYVYINLYDHFKKEGSYDIVIDISTFSFSGAQLNGVNAKAVVLVSN